MQGISQRTYRGVYGDIHINLGENHGTSVPYSGTEVFLLVETDERRKIIMGQLVEKKMNAFWWDLCSCLLFVGISGPAFHQFFEQDVDVTG